MSDATLTRMRLTNGVWEGLLSGRVAQRPRLRIRHLDDLVGEPEASPGQLRNLTRIPMSARSLAISLTVCSAARNMTCSVSRSA